MKFRYKVLIINIILLSVGIGTIGFFMIKKNYELALDSQIKNAVEENNLIQSSVEYELLGYLNEASYNIAPKLTTIGENLSSSMYINDSSMYIIYDGIVLYTNSTTSCPTELTTHSEYGKKIYTLTKEGKEHYIYTACCNQVSKKNLVIVNKRNITSVYQLIKKQQSYFAVLLLAVLFICAILMFILSTLLTRPLEKLAKVSKNFGSGDYTARANITSKDEVGNLASTYNQMAASVEEHIYELKDMVTRQEQFVADFTHEVKTPMTSIIGYADTLRSLELDRENQIMAASYIFNEGKRLEAMSMKLFDFIYTKKHEISLLPIHMPTLLGNIEESVIPSLKKADITLCPTKDMGYILGDKDLLKSAFINLLDNARKASSPGEKIIFSGTSKNDTYTVTIQDFGIGIKEEHLGRICDEFYMIDKSRSRKEGGAGLGLSLAALIFRSHNANLNIKSTEGVGTTISVSFPLHRKEDADE